VPGGPLRHSPLYWRDHRRQNAPWDSVSGLGSSIAVLVSNLTLPGAASVVCPPRTATRKSPEAASFTVSAPPRVMPECRAQCRCLQSAGGIPPCMSKFEAQSSLDSGNLGGARPVFSQMRLRTETRRWSASSSVNENPSQESRGHSTLDIIRVPRVGTGLFSKSPVGVDLRPGAAAGKDHKIPFSNTETGSPSIEIGIRPVAVDRLSNRWPRRSSARRFPNADGSVPNRPSASRRQA